MASRRKRAARFIHSRATGIRVQAARSAAPETPDTPAGPPDSISDGPDATPPDELVSGIAEVFAAIRAADELSRDAGGEEPGPVTDDAVTFRLLGELERLWQRAA